MVKKEVRFMVILYEFLEKAKEQELYLSQLIVLNRTFNFDLGRSCSIFPFIQLSKMFKQEF